MKTLIAIAGAALLWSGCEEDRSPPQSDLATQQGTGGAGQAGFGASAPLETDNPYVGDTQVISGKVERVENGSVTVRDDQGERVTVTVHPNTLLVIDGEQKTLSELREGTEIRASFDVTPTPAGKESAGSEIQIETLPAP